MNLLESIHELPKIEKIKVMEFLWNDLTAKTDAYPSPDWHEKILRKTEESMAQGAEELIDWNEAKQLLRNEFR